MSCIGTGKTVCISDRMMADREATRSSAQPMLQLFVCRSSKLCEFMKGFQRQSVSEHDLLYTDFQSLKVFLEGIENICSGIASAHSTKFDPARQVTYSKFKAVIHPLINNSRRNGCLLDASIVWTHFRGFIKGSVGCVYSDGLARSCPLTLEEYCKLPADRVKLDAAQRRQVYALFERYESYLSDNGLWDESGRVLSLFEVLMTTEIRDNNYTRRETQLYCNKIYVDEVLTCNTYLYCHVLHTTDLYILYCT